MMKELEMNRSVSYIMLQPNRVEGKPGMLFDSGSSNYHHKIGSTVKQDRR